MNITRPLFTVLLTITFLFSIPSVSEAGCFKNRSVVTKVTTKAKSIVQRTVRVLKHVLCGQ